MRRKIKVYMKIMAVRCTNCGELYMHDTDQNNGCPECGSRAKTVVK